MPVITDYAYGGRELDEFKKLAGDLIPGINLLEWEEDDVDGSFLMVNVYKPKWIEVLTTLEELFYQRRELSKLCGKLMPMCVSFAGYHSYHSVEVTQGDYEDTMKCLNTMMELTEKIYKLTGKLVAIG
jgi:hypothetical protein